MNSLTLVHWLLIGNMAMVVVVVGFILGLRRQQAQDTERLDILVGQLEQGHDAITKSTIGIGRRIKQLETKLSKAGRAPVMNGTDDARFDQASRLVGLGASADDLIDSLGVARAEAELLVSLRQKASA